MWASFCYLSEKLVGVKSENAGLLWNIYLCFHSFFSLLFSSFYFVVLHFLFQNQSVVGLLKSWVLFFPWGIPKNFMRKYGYSPVQLVRQTLQAEGHQCRLANARVHWPPGLAAGGRPDGCGLRRTFSRIFERERDETREVMVKESRVQRRRLLGGGVRWGGTRPRDDA